jgi:Tfp pilus assembly protein PilF
MKKIIILLSVLLGFISCSTVKEIPSDLSAAQLLQLGQNAFESKNYKAAEKYFITTIQRFGTNTNNYIEAQYELAHLYNTTKQYQKAYNIYNEILQMYDYSFDLPGAYKKLCQIGLSKIPTEKTAQFQNGSTTPEATE